MNLFAIWPYFVLMAVVMSAVALPLFRSVDSAVTTNTRYPTIDGLRGFLALGVFVFHLAVTHRFIATGVWAIPDSRFYALLGPIGVSLFFMITGFLFWKKMLRATGSIRWAELYVGRLFRIAPMYLVVVAIMLCIVFAHTGFRLSVPGDQLAISILQWLALGAIDTQSDVNGFRATHILAGVTWTIAYEWAFYASLLITSFFARGKRHLPFVATALLLSLVGKALFHIDAIGFASLFLAGMMVASLLHANIRVTAHETTCSAIALVCLAAIFAVARSGYGTLAALLLMTIFYLVCSGASFFGLLLTRSAQRLGAISYSLYLMQGLVLHLVFANSELKNLAMRSAENYWLVGGLCAVVLLVCASFGYVLIERPFVALGKRLFTRKPSIATRPAAIDEVAVNDIAVKEFVDIEPVANQRVA